MAALRSSQTFYAGSSTLATMVLTLLLIVVMFIASSAEPIRELLRKHHRFTHLVGSDAYHWLLIIVSFLAATLLIWQEVLSQDRDLAQLARSARKEIASNQWDDFKETPIGAIVLNFMSAQGREDKLWSLTAKTKLHISSKQESGSLTVCQLPVTVNLYEEVNGHLVDQRELYGLGCVRDDGSQLEFMPQPYLPADKVTVHLEGNYADGYLDSQAKELLKTRSVHTENGMSFVYSYVLWKNLEIADVSTIGELSRLHAVGISIRNCDSFDFNSSLASVQLMIVAADTLRMPLYVNADSFTCMKDNDEILYFATGLEFEEAIRRAYEDAIVSGSKGKSVVSNHTVFSPLDDAVVSKLSQPPF